jgi:hypothetical protein
MPGARHARVGNWKTFYGRHRRWSLDGTWEMMAAQSGHRAGKIWTDAAGLNHTRPESVLRKRTLAKSLGGLYSGWVQLVRE